MANITRIKAGEAPNRPADQQTKKPKNKNKAVPVPTKPSKAPEAAVEAKAPKVATKKEKNSGSKKPFILIRPFVAFFRYLRDAWKEIRQVRWPNRKATWKMVLAVFVYTAAFVVMITLLDLFFTWLFGLILGNK